MKSILKRNALKMLSKEIIDHLNRPCPRKIASFNLHQRGGFPSLPSCCPRHEFGKLMGTGLMTDVLFSLKCP